MMLRIAVAGVLALSVVPPGLSADDIQPDRLALVANFNAVSVYALFRGDDNVNAKAGLEYRVGEEKRFRPGHPLSRTGMRRFAGSIFHLKPDQPIEVRVIFEDPDAGGAAGTLTATTQTRSEKFPAGTGKTYHVGPRGNDADPGTRDRPFATIQHAVDLASPGDTILLLAGDYYESVTIRRSGRLDAYITLAGEPPPDGAEERELPSRVVGCHPGGPWRHLGHQIYVAGEKRVVGTVTGIGGRRLYHHGSLGALRSAGSPLDTGWWQDTRAGDLYVRVADGAAPRPGEIQLGLLPFGLRFEGCGYWIVQRVGLHLFGGGRYSRGIEIRNSHDIVVRQCRLDTVRTGIAVRKAGSRNCLIEHNRFADTGIYTWPWKACKGHDVEGAAVGLRGGGGNVVRFNTITGFFNGVVPGTWGDLRNEALNRDLDVHDNRFHRIGDDPLEPEGACMNVRFWNNRTRDTLQGISLAPITVGPTYVIRDRYVNFKQGAVKVSVSSRGPVFLYHVLGWTNRPRRNAIQSSGPWDNMHFRNCIVRGTRYVIEDFYRHPRGCSFDYCCLFTTARDSWIKWANRRYADLKDLSRGPTFGANISRVEPYAIDAKGALGRLNPELIDAGVRIPGVNDDFKGAAPDIGPDELR